MNRPNKTGHFGEFGGRFVPETLMSLLEDLEKVYKSLQKDKKFKEEFAFYLKEYAGRPTNLYFAKRLSAHLKTLKIYLKSLQHYCYALLWIIYHIESTHFYWIKYF